MLHNKFRSTSLIYDALLNKTLLTNFMKSEENLYQTAIDEFAKQNKVKADKLYIRKDAYGKNDIPVPGCYSLHTKERGDLSDFWKVFHQQQKILKISKQRDSIIDDILN